MKSLLPLLLLAACASTPPPSSELQSAVHPEVVQSGENSQNSFSIHRETCEIKLSVNEDTASKKKLISIDDTCDASHKDRYQDYLKILEALTAQYPKQEFAGVYSHSFYHLQIWDEEIANAMVNSPRWQAFEKNRKKHEVPNTIYVEVFNENQIAKELQETFGKVGLRIQLDKVEKVMEMKGRSLPFSQKYEKLMTREKKVPFSAGLYRFKII